MAEKDDYLVDILVDLGFVSPDKVAELRAEAQAAGVGVVDLMVANKVVRPADVTQAKAAHFGAEVVNLGEMKIEDDVIASVPRHIARKYRVVPVFKHENSADRGHRRSLRPGHHRQPPAPAARGDRLAGGSEPDIEAALSKYYGGPRRRHVPPTRGSRKPSRISRASTSRLRPRRWTTAGTVEADAPLIKLVNPLIVEAFKLRASDIHLEPLAKTFPRALPH